MMILLFAPLSILASSTLSSPMSATGSAQAGGSYLLHGPVAGLESQVYVEESTDSVFETVESPAPAFTSVLKRKVEVSIAKSLDAKGNARATWRFFDIEVKSDSSGPASTTPPPHKVGLLIDSVWKINELKSEGLVEASRKIEEGSMRAYFAIFQLPQRKVSVGETWEVKISPETGAVVNEQNLEGKLVAVSKVGREEVAEIRVSGSLETEAKIQMEGGADGEKLPDLKMLGTSKMEITYRMEVSTGRLLTVKRRSDTEQKMDLGDGTTTPPSANRFSSEMRPLNYVELCRHLLRRSPGPIPTRDISGSDAFALEPKRPQVPCPTRRSRSYWLIVTSI